MPKLPRVTSQEMVRALEKAGFVKDRQKGSHLTMRHPKTGCRAVVPMHRRTLGVGLTRDIIRHAGLSPDEFRELLG